MLELVKSLIVGMWVGVIFTLFHLQIPAPPVLSGIIGIFGVYLGMIVVNFLKGL